MSEVQTMDNQNVSTTKSSGYFRQGMSISLAAWILDGLLATLYYSFMLYPWNSHSLSIIWTMFSPFLILLSVVWVPITIIASIRSAKKGFKSAFKLVMVPFFITPFVFGYGIMMLLAYAGAY